MDAKVWDMVPDTIKNGNDIETFKKQSYKIEASKLSLQAMFSV